MYPITATVALALHIRRHGHIPACRVSSAQARGAAKKYCYWGAVRYRIALAVRGGYPTLIPCERASSDRRSERLARMDRETLAEREGRLPVIWSPGRLSDAQCQAILDDLPMLAR